MILCRIELGQVKECKKLSRSTKKSSRYGHLAMKRITDIKTFWRTITPLLQKAF